MQPAALLENLRQRRYLLPVLLLLCGFFVRMLYLDALSLWEDEGFSWIVISVDDFFATLSRDVHPPLYFLTLKFWTMLTGTSEFAMRFLSVLANMVGLALLYVLARELLRHRRVSAWMPLLAMGMFILSDLETSIAQDARSYTLLGIWILLAALAYLRWTRTASRRWAALWTISTALILYTHYVASFTVVAFGIHALLYLRGRQRLQAVGLMLLAGLLFSPWLLVLPQQVGKFAGDVVKGYPSNLTTLLYLHHFWLGGQWALLLGLLLVGVGVSVPRRWLPDRSAVLLLFWIVIPLALAFVANLYLPVLTENRLSQITPAVVLLIAFGLAQFPGSVRVFLVAVITFYGVTTLEVYRAKPPWESFATAIDQLAQQGDAVVLDFTGGDYPIQYYLDRDLDPQIPVASMWQWRTFQPASYESGMLEFMDTHATIWLARWSSDEEAFAKLNFTGHQQTYQRALGGGNFDWYLYRFDRLPQSEALARFANGMTLQSAAVHASLVDLLWTAEAPLSASYTISVKWLDAAGQVVAQVDAPPDPATNTWNPASVLYTPYRVDALPAGQYTVMLQVYEWFPEGITLQLTADGADHLIIGSTQVP